MRLKSKNTRRAVVAVTVVAALGGGGAALAAAGDPAREADQFEADVAERLGVSETELESAYEGAMIDSVERARRRGDISATDANEAEDAIRSGDLPPFAPPPIGRPGGPGGHAFPPIPDIASRYLGISESRLENRLENGETLAEVARAVGKALDGLREALLADARERLSKDVDAGRLDADDAQEMLTEMRSHLGDLLNGRMPEPPGPGAMGAPGPPPSFEYGGAPGFGPPGMVIPAPAPNDQEGSVLPAPPRN